MSKENFVLEKDWYYKGIQSWYDGKSLGHCFVRLDENNKIIETFQYIDKVLNSYIIGLNYHIEVSRNDDGKSVTINKRTPNFDLEVSQKIKNEWCEWSWSNRQRQKDYRATQKLIKESHNIENMTLVELKEFANKSYSNKELVARYIFLNIL